MELIPGIDIRGGKCVRLVQGDYARETVFGDDPVAMAARWAREGADRLHVVDLDGARERRPVNDAVVRQIIEGVAIPVQVAGGMRDAAVIDAWMAAGADRVVVGTLAAEDPDAVAASIERHGSERIAIAVDVKGGEAATAGWMRSSGVAAHDFVRDLASRGARKFVYTDVQRDGIAGHLDYDALRALIAALEDTGAPSRLIYSGGVSSIADVVALNEYDLDGVIIGRALYDGSIDLGFAKRALVTGDGTA